jgi:hypothetical protein
MKAMPESCIVRRADACKHKKAAVLIGINYAGTANALQGCEADVTAMQQMLQTRFGFSDFVVLKQSSGDPKMQPTRANILRTLTDLARRSKTDGLEQVVIQYSGHGTQTHDHDGDEAANREDTGGNDDAIVDQNLELIVDDTLRGILNLFSPWCRVLVVIDACHSGTGLDLPLLWPVFTPTIAKICSTTAPVANVLCISGCTDRETSADTARTDPRTGEQQFGGAMTLSLIDCMFGARDVFALLESMHAWMKRSGYTQHPQLTSSRPLFEGDNLTKWLN